MIKELEITDTIQDIVDEYENYRESGWRYLIYLDPPFNSSRTWLFLTNAPKR